MSETKTKTTTAAGKPSTLNTTAKMNECKGKDKEMAATAENLPTPLLSNNRKLLLKNQLHLNLSVNNNEQIKKIYSEEDRRSKRSVRIPATAETEQDRTAEVVKFKDDVSYLETTTVTTVPQIQIKQQTSIIEATTTSTKITPCLSSSVAAASSSSSLLNSSPSALAKFNRIIDSTMPETDCYLQQPQQQHQEQKQKEKIQQQQQLQQQERKHGIVATYDLKERRKIDFISSYDDDVGLDVEIDNGDVEENNDHRSSVTGTVESIDENDDNQMKRNDVHYLLKQLNSFSDIEEIEIIDMKQTRQQHHQQHQEQQQPHQAVTARNLSTTTSAIATAAVITHSPTTTSLVIISPSSQSHKESRHIMRRFASLHQQRQYPERYHQRLQHERQLPQHNHHPQRYYTLNASGGNLLELGDRIERLDPAMEQQYLLQQFDDYLFESCHYLETNYFAATYRTAMIESSSHEFRPSTTTGTRSSPSAASSPHSFEIHEVELPSVICRAPPPPPSPTRRFNMQARLTSSGVQTELTASSLSSTTTTTSHTATHSIAKSTSGSSGVSACSYASSTEQRRRMPFFKCCYAPIGRWREKRSTAATVVAGTSGSGGGGSGSHKTRDRDKSKAEASRGGSERQQKQQLKQTKQHPHAGKSGSAV